jgi:carbamoyl-phosphate synthase small subunit
MATALATSRRRTRVFVVAYDFGQAQYLRMLAGLWLPRQCGAGTNVGCRRRVIARWRLSRATDLAISESCDYAIRATRTLIDKGLPTFGICLGHQILALASGAKTFKMKFGHHGANHPVKDLDSGRVSITSQNHGFAVDENTLPSTLRSTHVSLFDGTLQGLARTDKPAFCFQGHPEASPGPHDIGICSSLRQADGEKQMAKRTDLKSILIIGATDRDRTGLRV